MNFETYLFRAFRCVTIEDPVDSKLTDETLALAVTANENLKSLGYTMTAKDTVALAKSASLTGICDRIAPLVHLVKAAPMYPNFPKQVMDMDEATFRFHQMVHYFSTYGMEELFGVKVRRGWLPDETEAGKAEKEKGKKDKTLLQYKTLELVPDSQKYAYCLRRILSRKERMTDEEKLHVRESLLGLEASGDFLSISSMKIPFKQNLLELFCIAFEQMDADTFRESMRVVCQHTGDVWKCTDYVLTRCDYHFTTSQKKRLVKLLESYPIADFRTNLVLSQRKAQRIIRVLEFLSYNQFSGNAECREAVRALRSGELKSWESQAKFLLKGDKDSALAFIAKRPGQMLRWLAWLLRQGYTEAAISEALLSGAEKLSIQTLNSVLVQFGRPSGKAEAQGVFRVCYELLAAKLRSVTTELKGKKIYLDCGDISLEDSILMGNTKSPLTGYLKSGMAYRIPDGTRHIRFFTYWNDKERVDVDLHAELYRYDTGFAHVGWNGDYNTMGVATSGDITHSDAAEYIDVDLNNPKAPDYVTFNIHDYHSNGCRFNDIQTCFCGLMAVNELGEEVALYQPQNCFYSHDLTGADTRDIAYGFLDVRKRVLVFVGEFNRYLRANEYNPTTFGLGAYLRILLKAQEAEIVTEKEQADLVLSVERKEGTVNMVEHNYWLDV